MSTEYVTASVTAQVDITGSVINVALPSKGVEPVTWLTTEVTSVVQASGKWTATYRVLVGPVGDVTLVAGKYDWWRKVTDNPEVPVANVGTLDVADGWTTPA
ncbi:MAG: hypothetical protein ACRDQA_05180 [Nocardioidaceae bacterium]